MEKDHPLELREEPYFFLLESSLGGRYTIAAWDPIEVIEAKPGVNFLELLRSKIAASPVIDAPDLPFAGGWIGYLSYELYSEIEKKVTPRETNLLPKAVMACYDKFYLYDHVLQKGSFYSFSLGSRRSAPTFVKEAASDSPRRLREPLPVDYLESVKKILDLIAAGDCYQVNLSRKFTVPVSQPSSFIYQRLRETSPAPYSAYLNLGEAQILSSSPESFLELDGRRVITRPIKGTRPRGATPTEDARLKEELSMSAKDRAELLMITDLERNDLGRVCRPGSVRVRDLRKVETFPQVHHLISTVEGNLREGCDLVDLLGATFPGGSITGAPKIRAMQIIRELEPHAREAYCGAIGYVSLNGKAQFNVAIRTMVIAQESCERASDSLRTSEPSGGSGGARSDPPVRRKAHFWSGGGIVADSDPQAEYEETVIKAEGLRRALGL